MHTHRVKVFNRADDDAVVIAITHHFHFELFPADYGFFKQHFAGRRSIQTALDNLDKLFTIVGNTAARTAHGEGRTDHGRVADLGLYGQRFFHRVSDT